MAKKLNFQLFENFKAAAEQKGIEVKPGPSYYSIQFENGRYIYCWTPLNKMWHLMNYYEGKEWDRALDHLKNNFSDFHLEIDSRGHKEGVAECFLREAWNPDITVDEIANIIEILQDDVRLERRRLLANIEFSEDE
jgi:hypothetical protein